MAPRKEPYERKAKVLGLYEGDDFVPTEILCECDPILYKQIFQTAGRTDRLTKIIRLDREQGKLMYQAWSRNGVIEIGMEAKFCPVCGNLIRSEQENLQSEESVEPSLIPSENSEVI
jgi:hypothetical protein